MVTTVIKRDGETVPYDTEKVRGSIRAACEDSGVEEEKTGDVVEKVASSLEEELKGQETVQTQDIRDRVLDLLEAEEPEAAQAWRAYEEGKEKA
ncbi:MAG: ATP cone domain-containing protein [bacterium]|nr:ATP cone domain-containing protein [bacterium]